MNAIGKEMSIAAALLMVFCLTGAAVVGFTQQQTEAQILENQRLALLDRLNQVLPSDAYDNEITQDVIQRTDPFYLGSKKPKEIFLAKKNGKPVAAIVSATAPDGYSGEIQFIVGIDTQQHITGVRIVSHKETPGLGDGIDIERSNWLLQFDGKSLTNPNREHWRVIKDGGAFDQLTGATITPRAVVKATHRVLQYSEEHFDEWFNPTPKEADHE